MNHTRGDGDDTIASHMGKYSEIWILRAKPTASPEGTTPTPPRTASDSRPQNEDGLPRYRTPDDVERILLAQDRQLAGDTSPAQGLFLVHVRYPENEDEL